MYLDPAKSCITPLEVHMPVWPIQGNNQEIIGIGVHVIHAGKRAC